jgi:hypothetical protein
MQKIRITYVIISFLGVIAAYHYADLTTQTSSYLNYVSYYGTVATAIGLLITVAEVLHNVTITRSVQEEARTIFNHVKQIENASSISDCLATIDDVSNLVSKEDYSSALRSFQFLRKLCVKIIPQVSEIDDCEDRLSALGNVEFMLHKATHTSAKAPLSKKQKTDLLKDILFLKEQIEKLNPVRNTQNVTS